MLKRLLMKDYLAVEYKKNKTNESAWDNKLYEIEIVAVDKKVKTHYESYSEEVDEWRENVRHFAQRKK